MHRMNPRRMAYELSIDNAARPWEVPRGKDPDGNAVAFSPGQKLSFPSMCPGSPGVRFCKHPQTEQICFTLCVMSTASWYCKQALDSFAGVLEAAMSGRPFPDLFYASPRKPNGDKSSAYCRDVRSVFKWLASASANPDGGQYHGGSRQDPLRWKEAPFFRCFLAWRLVEEHRTYMSFGQWRVFDYSEQRDGLWLRNVERPRDAQLAQNLHLIAGVALEVAQFRGTDPSQRALQLLSPIARAPSNASAPSRVGGAGPSNELLSFAERQEVHSTAGRFSQPVAVRPNEGDGLATLLDASANIGTGDELEEGEIREDQSAEEELLQAPVPTQQPPSDKAGPPARSGSPGGSRRDRGAADLLPEEDDDSDEDDTPLSFRLKRRRA